MFCSCGGWSGAGILWLNSLLSNLHHVTLNLPWCCFPVPDAEAAMRQSESSPDFASNQFSSCYVITLRMHKLGKQNQRRFEAHEVTSILGLLSQLITADRRRRGGRGRGGGWFGVGAGRRRRVGGGCCPRPSLYSGVQTVSVFSLGLGRCAPVPLSVRVRPRSLALSSSRLVLFVHPTALNINFT